MFSFLFFTSQHVFSGSLRPEDDDFDIEEEMQKLHPPPPPSSRQTLPPELETGSRRGLVGDHAVMVIFEDSDSDSDGPIHYRDDDDDDEEDEEVPTSKMHQFHRSFMQLFLFFPCCSSKC